jgi:hypothetical protein
VAARRLVVVMLVLLAVSTLAAALLPPPENRETPPAQTRPKEQRQTREPQRAEQDGLLLAARMRLGRREPKTVRIELGDQLRLNVAAPFGDDVEIPALGLTQAVTPFAPATFDLLATRIGTFPVRAVDSGLVAGRLLVGRPGRGRCGVSRPEAPRGRGSIPSCALRDRPQSQAHGRSARRP